MWVLMLKSGVHATIAGVLLAFTIPFSAKRDDAGSPSNRLEHVLHKPVAFVVLPLFALANTGVVFGADWAEALTSANSLGIGIGLMLGKPVGIALLTLLAVIWSGGMWSGPACWAVSASPCRSSLPTLPSRRVQRWSMRRRWPSCWRR
jgi:Na+/H+ antiporter NhaA